MEGEFKLDKFQEEAINFAKNNYSVIVSAPTGAGKTLIAEKIIEECLYKNKGVVYTAPIKALSNQKFRDFSKKYPQKVGILTGDVSINRDAPILIMTTEIFRNAILVEPDDFKYREWVIFDEIHYLDDIERGTVWEEAIILLPSHMRMLALSATIPNIKEFSSWLEKVHKFPLGVVIEKNRPVPLHFSFQYNNQIFDSFASLKKFENLNREALSLKQQDKYYQIKPNRLFNLIDYIKKRNIFPCIYFLFSRRRCEELAEEASNFDLLNPQEKKKITQLFNELISKFNITSLHIDFLSPLVKKGIAYHHAGLLPTLKEIIEQLFASGLIKLIFTTETFALGINMPAKTVVFDTVSKFYGRYHRYLKVRDLYQMAGRAGRRGIDTQGYVIIKINPQGFDLDALENMLYGEYEPIISQFNSCYATILNLYKVMGEKIYDIYPLSFHFHQATNLEKKEAIELLKRKIILLKDMNYIIENGISWKADLASKVYSFELQIGELFSNGFLNSLDAKTLFLVITALVYEPRKGEKKPQLNKKIKKLKRFLNIFIKDINQKERKLRIYPLSKKFYFHLARVSEGWFDGLKFNDLLSLSSIDEGEIVRYFRMSIQVLREMLTSKIINQELKAKIFYILKRVNRDVIDAESQLQRQI
ncbi:MAG: DEAD/DEAH box helicase [Candidatus Omnitrophica bacterium]|nr:DEAD/DEAH box helicase [Candidatus Omnitrophota bacterium]